jgi:sulfoxide reductase catalytic subunit YedY
MMKKRLPSDRADHVDPGEITPMHLYLSRREFMRSAAVAAGGLALAACAPAQPTALPGAGNESADDVDEMGNSINTFYETTHYNNFYEFTTNPSGVADLAKDFKTSPWQIEVGGLVDAPKTYSYEDLISHFQPEERIYRLRCVEGWSLVIPWVGFPLHKLLAEAQPTAEAKYVRFESVLRPEEMPGQRQDLFPWPYQEGLRLDEAAHDLTLLATGMYGGALPPQNGGGVRLVVPWKYGFKSIKSVVKIELVGDQPATLWNTIAANEYGFYSNVNPNVDHPRWSQATERRIGETSRRETLLFNGYADQVASLYEGMDLKEYY